MSDQQKMTLMTKGAKLRFKDVTGVEGEIIQVDKIEDSNLIKVFVDIPGNEPIFFITGPEPDTSKPNVLLLDQIELII